MQLWAPFIIILQLRWMLKYVEHVRSIIRLAQFTVTILFTKPKTFAAPTIALHFLSVINYFVPLTLMSHISGISSLISLF
jgi:hypothetical protein